MTSLFTSRETRNPAALASFSSNHCFTCIAMNICCLGYFGLLGLRWPHLEPSKSTPPLDIIPNSDSLQSSPESGRKYAVHSELGVLKIGLFSSLIVIDTNSSHIIDFLVDSTADPSLHLERPLFVR